LVNYQDTLILAALHGLLVTVEAGTAVDHLQHLSPPLAGRPSGHLGSGPKLKFLSPGARSKVEILITWGQVQS